MELKWGLTIVKLTLNHGLENRTCSTSIDIFWNSEVKLDSRADWQNLWSVTWCWENLENWHFKVKALTCSISFSISVARMTSGPRTAYSMVLMQGLMLLMVRVWSHCCCSILRGVVVILRLKTTLDKGWLRGLMMMGENSERWEEREILRSTSKERKLSCRVGNFLFHQEPNWAFWELKPTMLTLKYYGLIIDENVLFQFFKCKMFFTKR